MERNTAFLKREFRKALPPVMLSVLGGTINTFIDSVYVSRRLSADALAAVNVSMPVFLILCTAGCLLGMGAYISASRAIGKHETKEARAFYHSSLLLDFICGFFFMVCGFAFPNAVARVCCSDPVLFPMVRDYCRISLIGAIPAILVYLPTYFLQLDARGRDTAVMSGIMIISDVILDYIFLYILDGGIAGAAWASVMALWISCLYGFFRLQHKDGLFCFSLKDLKLYRPKSAVLFGSSSAAGNLLDAVRLFILNWLIFHAGGAKALAVWALINTFAELSLAVTSGVPSTAAPLLGICSSGHDNEGIRMIVRQELETGLTLIAIFSLFAIPLHRTAARFFRIEGSLLFPFLCLGFAVVPALCCGIYSSYFNATGHVMLSNFIMTLRTLVMPVFFAGIFLLLRVPIWLFLPAGLWMTLFLSLGLVRLVSGWTRGQEHELSGILLLDDYLERNGKIRSFSIPSTGEMICQASEEIVGFCMENHMEPRLANRMGLAIEEVMVVMAERSLEKKEEPVDIRAYSAESRIGIGIMCFGKKYDPFEEADRNRDDFNMGVNLIRKSSKECHYIYTLGMNIIAVEF